MIRVPEDIIDSHARLARRVRNLETRAEFYWQGEPADSPWVDLDVATGWRLSYSSLPPQVRRLSQRIVFRGRIESNTGSNPAPDKVLTVPGAFRPYMDVYLPASFPCIEASGAAGSFDYQTAVVLTVTPAGEMKLVARKGMAGGDLFSYSGQVLGIDAVHYIAQGNVILGG